MSSLKRRLSDDSDSDEQSGRDSKIRRPTVYDAVVGRFGRNAFLPTDHIDQKIGGPIRPDEVLYKAANAPTRYEETDHYFAHAKLPEDQKLPSGDLLSALHTYFSQFYSRSVGYVDRRVYQSMDETALLALGILMEETARETLGWTGHLAFLESDEEDGDSHDDEEGEHEGGREDESEHEAEQAEKRSKTPTTEMGEDELESSVDGSLQSSQYSE